jgi:hypothetical protein
MKCLTLNEPWAMLVALGGKTIETRSWGTKYRGKLAIHASAKFTREMKMLCFREPFASVLRRGGYVATSELPLGCVIATCTLVDCVVIPRAKTFYPSHAVGKWLWSLPPDEPEFSFGDFTPMRYAWMLEDVKRLPVLAPAKGMLGLWEWNGG